MNRNVSALDLIEARDTLLAGGGEEKVVRQHAGGKLIARERINVLLDDGSFEEYFIFESHRCTQFGMSSERLPSDGVITGYGTIYGRPVCVFSQDFTVMGGSLGEAHANKICKLMDKAAMMGVPLIGINDSGGARIQEGVCSLAGYGEVFKRNVAMSGVVPQISLIMGPCAGGAVYSPALTDFIFMVRDTSYMFVTGPDVVKQVMHEDISFEGLGGASIHESKSGVADAVYDNDIDLLLDVRRLFTFLPSSSKEKPPVLLFEGVVEKNSDDCLHLDSLISSDNPSKPYNMMEVVETLVDEREFFEIQEGHAKNIVVGFGRITGIPVGIVANQPMEKAGCLDISASRKAARFVRFCDAFNIPVITLIDVPGFLPGSAQEHNSIIKHGAKLLYAYAESTVPKISVITRKAYGGAYIVMSSKHLGGDVNYCWPNAEIAVLGANSAAGILFRKYANDPEVMKSKTDEYKEMLSGPALALSRGYIEECIRPRNTRWRLARSLNLLFNTMDVQQHGKLPKYEKKHDNLPM